MIKQQIAFVPIQKVDVERREVWGVLAEERLDKAGEIMDYEGSKPHFEAWSKAISDATEGKSVGNLREMHRADSAAGKLVSLNFNDASKCIEIGAKVVDDVAWSKCLEGVYSGFSVGGDYVTRNAEAGFTRYVAAPCEASLVDNPCMHGATFHVLKSDGSSELRKFVDQGDLVTKWAEGLLLKGAGEALAAGDDAIEAVKRMAVDLLGMEGTPDTWAIEDLMTAISRIVSARWTARYAVDEAQGGSMSASAQPTVTKAADPAVITTPADAAPAAAPAADAVDLTKVLEAVSGLHNVVEAGATKAAADSATLQKAMGEVIAKAVNDTKIELKAGLDAIDARLKKVESAPQSPGRPVQKKLGDELVASVNAIDEVIATAKAAGATPEMLRKMVMAASEASIVPLR